MDDTGTATTTPRRSRYAGASPGEINMALRAHTARRAMAFFDRLSPEERERVREGTGVVKGYAWQLRERDARGRFMPGRVS
jgi:hypothetical protein